MGISFQEAAEQNDDGFIWGEDWNLSRKQIAFGPIKI